MVLAAAEMSAVTALLLKNSMQIGGVAPAKLRMAWGSAQTPSPTMRPVAMGMTSMTASAPFFQAMYEPMAEPRHMSTATLSTTLWSETRTQRSMEAWH